MTSRTVTRAASQDGTTWALSSRRSRSLGRYRLVVTAGSDKGLARDLDRDELKIGKGADADIVLTDPTVSRYHCLIVASPLGPLVRDVGSRNGVRIDGNWIQSAYLRAGALVRLGDTAFVLELLDAEGSGDGVSLPTSPLGQSAPMQRIMALVPRLANSEATLLIEGETGTGKTLLARLIHKESPRHNTPFVIIDCGAIPSALVESELFGHERGAFTGASSMRVGAFEAADGGTILLDEIGELPLEMQPKLLRAIEQRVVRRVGSNADREINVRIIAATNRDLEQEVRQGKFRSDLYYRLAGVRIVVPPLRERPEDIPGLIANFLREFRGGEHVEPPKVMLDTFLRQSWPGNVRELKNAVERALLLGDVAALDAALSAPVAAPFSALEQGLPFRAAKEKAIDSWERHYLENLLQQADGNISRASRMAQTDRTYLRDLLRKHRLGPFR
jgi:DNA-binding NtrC family response regulator